MLLTEATIFRDDNWQQHPYWAVLFKVQISTRLYQKGKIRFSNMIFFQKQNMVEQSGTKRKEESVSIQKASLVYSTKFCIIRGN